MTCVRRNRRVTLFSPHLRPPVSDANDAGVCMLQRLELSSGNRSHSTKPTKPKQIVAYSVRCSGAQPKPTPSLETAEKSQNPLEQRVSAEGRTLSTLCVARFESQDLASRPRLVPGGTACAAPAGSNWTRDLSVKQPTRPSCTRPLEENSD